MRRALWFTLLLSSACGYHLVYGGQADKFHVVLTRSLVADAVASGEVVSGVREALAKEGALAGGDGYPRIEVDGQAFVLMAQEARTATGRYREPTLFASDARHNDS